MAKARWLKPEFFTDPKVSSLSDQATLLYPALWVESDDGGVAPGDPRIIYGRRFITRQTWTVKTVEAGLRELESAGLVRRFVHKGEPWVLIPRLMANQGTRPKDWRHLGELHLSLTAQVLEKQSVSSKQNAELPETNGEPTQCTPKQLLVAGAVASAGAETAGASRRNEPAKEWGRTFALEHLLKFCYQGKRPAEDELEQAMKWWRKKEQGGENPDRIVAALRGAPAVAPDLRKGPWNPARWFSKVGPWVNLYERSITADGKSGRPRTAEELLRPLNRAIQERQAS